ncbi:MAG: hypothetical protein IJ719_19830 [Clostridia bacterium]|nr:hypothetical protein [Clostridia bacterium]
MFYFEKDYIMRMIRELTQMLSVMLFGRKLGEGEELVAFMEEGGEKNDYLRRMIDEGQVNAAEEKLFDLLETSGWAEKEKAALAISFYDYLNSKSDAFLENAEFPREEIARGLEDAMEALNVSIPDYLQI